MIRSRNMNDKLNFEIRMDNLLVEAPHITEVYNKEVLKINQELDKYFCIIKLNEALRGCALSYHIINTIPLVKFIQLEKTSSTEIKMFLQQLVEAYLQIKEANLQANSILLDVNYMFWDINQNQLKLVYLPFQRSEVLEDSLKQLLIRIFGELWSPKRKSELKLAQKVMAAYKEKQFTFETFQKLVEVEVNRKKGFFPIFDFKLKKKSIYIPPQPVATPNHRQKHQERNSNLESDTKFIIQPINETETQFIGGNPGGRQPLLKVKMIMANMVLEEYVDSFPCIVGRSQEATLQIEDIKVSRQHAHISVDKDGFIIEDIGSSNGVKVNGERLNPGQKVRIYEGDMIQVGASEIHITQEVY